MECDKIGIAHNCYSALLFNRICSALDKLNYLNFLKRGKSLMLTGIIFLVMLMCMHLDGRVAKVWLLIKLSIGVWLKNE